MFESRLSPRMVNQLLLLWHCLWILITFTSECPLDPNFNYPQYHLIKQADYVVHPDQPLNITGQVNCTSNFSGCYLYPDWFVRVSSDNYEQHSLLTDKKSKIVNEIKFNITGSSTTLCERNLSQDSFHIVIESIGSYEEVLLTIGLRRAGFGRVETIAPIKKYVPKISSRQIKDSPAVVINEGDNANITCEKPATDANVTQMYWSLTGSSLLENVTLNDSKMIPLSNGHTLDIEINFSIDSDLHVFSMIISNLTVCLSGLTVSCEVQWQEDNIHWPIQPSGHVAVIVVLPRKRYIPEISSRQIKDSPAVVIKEGDNANITCEKPATDANVTQMYWSLTGSCLLKDEILNDSKIIPLSNGHTLDIEINTSIDSDLHVFSMIISNLTLCLNGLTVSCEVQWEEGDRTQPLGQAAVIVVLPRKKLEIFSDQSRIMSVSEGENVTLLCKRSVGTLAEWLFTFPNGTELYFSKNETFLRQFGVDFCNSTLIDENLLEFGATLMSVSEEFNKLTIHCAARESEESDLINSVEYIVIVKKESNETNDTQIFFLSPLSKDDLVAIITSPLSAVIAFLIGVVIIIILVIGFITRTRNPALQGSASHRTTAFTNDVADETNDVADDETNDVADETNDVITEYLDQSVTRQDQSD